MLYALAPGGSPGDPQGIYSSVTPAKMCDKMTSIFFLHHLGRQRHHRERGASRLPEGPPGARQEGDG